MKIIVKMNSFYGCDCSGCGYGSGYEMEMDVEDEALANILAREIEAHDGCLKMEDVKALIAGGVTELDALHDKLWDEVVQMDVDYWLEQGDDGCGTIEEWEETDLESGRYKPEISFEDFLDEEGVDTEAEDFDKDDWEYEYHNYIMEDYRNWVANLDDREKAERYGLDLNVVIMECNGEYEIVLPDNSN